MFQSSQRLRSSWGLPFALCLLATTGCGDDPPARRPPLPASDASVGAGGMVGGGGSPTGSGGALVGTGGQIVGGGGSVGSGGRLGGSDAGMDASMDGSVEPDGGVEGGVEGGTECSGITDCVDDDGCCPDSCGVASDNDCSVGCGNGRVEEGELCDGNCPDLEACDDLVACSVDSVVGSAATCDAECHHESITECVDDDGCCAPGCDDTTDNDCSGTCGDNVVDDNETCDGDCPTDCDDGNSCTRNALVGDIANCTAQCSVDPIQSCVNGDGCCAPGCNSLADDDCPVTCGNGVVEEGERCDGNCPATCNDGDACTSDVRTGAVTTCDAECTFPAITACIDGDGCCPTDCNNNNDDDCPVTCGNGVVEETEECDGNCPTSCDDGLDCTTDTLTGTGCSRQCTHSDITSCTNGDGCCASGCNTSNDDDCSATCGDGTVNGTETCDGNCPASCDDSNSCTTDVRTGQNDQCNVQCSNQPITACSNGDGCCPSGCNGANDNDCVSECPNGITEPGETCDGNCPTSCNDGNACTNDSLTGSAAECTAECVTSPVTSCNLSSADQCCPSNCTEDNDEDCALNVCLTEADGRGEDPQDNCIICGCTNCRDELDLCFNGNPDVADDTAQGGPAAGTPKSELCAAVVFCGKESNCTGTDCYGIFSPGPCRPEIEAAAESTNLFTILDRQTNTSYAVGRANAVGECTDNDCAGLCTN